MGAAEPKIMTVIIAGGGTGGHLYPGIAVARQLVATRPGTVVTFAGTTQGIEARVIPREGFELDTIRSGGLKGKSLAGRARGAGLIPLGLLDACRMIAQQTSDVGCAAVDGDFEVFAKATARLSQVPHLVDAQTQAARKTIWLHLAHDDDELVVFQGVAIGVDGGFVGGGFDDARFVVEFEDGQFAALAVDDAHVSDDTREQLGFA